MMIAVESTLTLRARSSANRRN